MKLDPLFTRSLTSALCLLVCAPCLGAEIGEADVAELKRAIQALQAQNGALAQRLQALEAERASPAPAAPVLAAPAPADTEALTRRVQELETGKTAQEDATRAIIRDSVSKLGSKINQAVTLGGALEMRAGRAQDFAGETTSALHFSTAELDLEIQTNPWSTASLVMGYVDGGDLLFANNRGFESGVDRFSVDTASITVGDVQRFPLYVKAGRMNLAYGSSTGVHRADVLSIESPLTTDAFEVRRDAIGIGFAWPTPAPTRAAPPVVVPPVRPQLLAPLVSALGQQLGYSAPPERVKPPNPVSQAPNPPPFYGSLYFYEGNSLGSEPGFAHNLNGRLGYRASGHCGKAYSELSSADLCPWSLDFNVDYISSVFDSRFLSAEYRPFLGQLGPVRGLASTVKLSLGPVQLVGEWNGAIDRAVFRDAAGTPIDIQPSAWQLALGYQFDWNPWVEAIGAQGTYVALGYSRSSDLAGARQSLNSGLTRVGFLPRSRWTLTFSEWVQEGLKVQLEYSRIQDYAVTQGGTGASGNGLQMSLTYNW
jgi:hypothetical protein